MRKYLELGLEAPVYGLRQPRARIVEPFERYLQERVQTFPDLSGARLLREIREMGYEGGYSAVTDFLREVRPPRQTQFERRFETPPKQAQVDCAEFAVEFTDEPRADARPSLSQPADANPGSGITKAENHLTALQNLFRQPEPALIDDHRDSA